MTDNNTRQYGKSLYLWLAVSAVILIVFDQLMKHVAVVSLKDQPAIVLIDGVLELRYLENRGAAFGILQNAQGVFTVITLVFVAISIYFIVKVPKNRHYLPLMIAFTVLFSGAIGNFIDRTVNKYVVDFIYFSIIDFPIFNVADIYVTLSVIAIFIMILFKYKDKDMEFLFGSKSKSDENNNN